MDKRKGLGLVCGKPMPPLSELEKMYEGSDEDMPETTAVATLEDIKPPEENSTLVSNGTITPTTAKKYADEILKILSGQDAPQPIIPMKKYKKPEVPYIVGCTERERIPENPNCNVFKGDDYGITSKTNAFNEDEDEYCGDTPGFYINGYSLSKSIFNAHANEIASKLLSNENNPIIGSSDSEDTMIYELHFPKCRFSPVPSTSKDCETISINDQK
nr:uncharacterized protein LOC117987607 [Maniola hyperantus]